MKTRDQNDRSARRTHKTSIPTTRRQRTLTAFGCEALEGRKLMTGFAGASEAMRFPGGPAELGGMAGGGDFHGANSIRSQGARADAAANTDAATTAPGTDSATADGSSTGGAGMRTAFAQQNDSGGDDHLPSMHHGNFMRDGEGGDSERGGASEGDSQPAGMRDWQAWGMPGGTEGSRGDDVPMAGQDRDGQTTGNTQLDTDFAKLRTDEQAIHDKSEVTPVLMAAVRKDLDAIDQAKTGTADATALKTLQTDQQTIFSSQTAPTDAQQTQLQADHDAVLKSQGVSQTLIDQLAADQLAIKTASHFTADDQTLLDADHKAIETDRAATQPTDDGSTAATETATPAVATPAPATTTASTTPAATSSGDARTTATPVAAAATTSAAPTDDSSDATPPAAAPTTPPTDPAIDQNTMPTTSPQGMGRGVHGTMTHHGRPMNRGAGGLGHHGGGAGTVGHHFRRGLPS